MNFRVVSKYSLLFLLGISSWIPVLVINIIYWVTYLTNGFVVYPEILTEPVRSGLYAAFIVTNYFLVFQLIKRIEKWDVIDLLWKLLVIGITGIALVFLFTIIEDYTVEMSAYPQIKALSMSVKLYAVLIFSLSTMFIFRKLILYQKNKRKVFLWNILQGTFLVGLLRMFLGMQGTVTTDFAFMGTPVSELVTTILLPTFVIASLILSVNVNWSAYLNFNQKLRSLFLLFILIILFVAFFMQFPHDGLAYEVTDPDANGLEMLLSGKYLLFAQLFLFPLIYALLSGLVLIFNLQTSSVFEQRNIELATIQRINQSIQSNLETEEILRTLLDASLLTSNATGGWIQTFPEGKLEEGRLSYSKNVSREEIEYLKSRQDLTLEVIEQGRHIHIRNLRKHKNFRYAKTRLRSLLALPILTTKHPVGVVFLVNELSNSFEEETILSLVSLTEQSGISIQNAELVAQSIDLEIYKEQLKIAKRFQKDILPQTLPGDEQIEITVRSQEVDEIGGDFYDVIQKGPTYKIAVGDVSGKGTTAAFYMAETKGIFQALTQLDMGVREFVLNTNMALSNCLRKNSFMTLSYVHIHTDRKEIELMRAGHCETLYYDSTKDELLALDGGGPGLAIVRNEGYANFLPEPERFSYHPGDLLILYTDGIIEAHNEERDEFGMDRLKEIVFRLRQRDSQVIAETLVQQAKAFTGGDIDDDYSILVVKFL